ncbi:MAG: hypothetical protein RLZ98_1465 [Pseudomonadota bacterium]|jgi:hypothetical protein
MKITLALTALAIGVLLAVRVPEHAGRGEPVPIGSAPHAGKTALYEAARP